MTINCPSTDYLTRLSISSWSMVILSSWTCTLASHRWESRVDKYLTFHPSWIGISTVLLLWRDCFSLAGLTVHTSVPDSFWTNLMFLAVVVWRSLATMLNKTLTSWETLFFSPLQNLPYLLRMSVLAEVSRHKSTCCSKNVLVHLGQDQINLTAVSQALYSWLAFSPPKSHSIDP